ncbi:hypothetical protein R1flu_012844 [Riccia fluitans]|uniref:LysM domain-containing protein n=1 Tax=Riccia fluitans TaxID=41844 RepID=A0ABD1ZFU9_9MARC
MSGAGSAAPKGGKAGGDKDNTVAQVAGAVIASGVVWSLYKSVRGRGGATTPAAEETTEVKPTPSKSRTNSDVSYNVVKGDTLWNISRRYGVTVDDVRDANAIPDVNYIVPGETFIIPQ